MFIKLLINITILSILLCANAKADITSGLVGWWTFDEGSGSTANDSSGSGFTGTLINSPTWITGKIGPFALSFASASSQSVSVAGIPANWTVLQPTAAFSESAWIKSTATTPSTIISTWSFLSTSGVHFEFSDGGSGKIQLYIINSTGVTSINALDTTTINDGNWHMVTVTYSGNANNNGIKFYVDGVFSSQGTTGGTSPGTLQNSVLNIAKLGGGTPEYLNGSEDDVRIYSRELTSGDVAQLYNYTGFNHTSSISGVSTISGVSNLN